MNIKGPLFLIGFMGAGKTSVGEKLAEICGTSVVDSDQEIERKVKMTIPEIFAEYGEVYFRRVESDVLSELSQEPVIITTGGGIILKEDNREVLKKCKTIFLQAHPRSILERVGLDSGRPLLQNKSLEEVTDMYQTRMPYYLECASSVVDTSELSIEEVAQMIIQKMNDF
ncbi:shikimate kinase [Bacillus sp. SD088]|uniref:shikimate kinase n=1 Tax=Bacillus sp. SD088 TaxID=2782012 RepID=UPI001A96B138|nr:shikimate kinase [Bacillus sp. SD088]MBO0995257.1 shikimate kinase [Bacillus sp. SD088]